MTIISVSNMIGTSWSKENEY